MVGEHAAGGGEVNMADVARRAGVSIATVSRALRDVPGVSQPTRDRIRAIAQELSYVVSPEASALSRGATGRVAIVMPRLDAWFYSAMLASMAPVLRGAGLDMLVYQVDGEEQRTRFLRELPARRKADAVILTALPMAQAEVERLDLMGVHVVVAGGEVRDYPHVHVDDLAAGRTAVQHLLDLGHRRIAMIRTSDTDGTTWSSDLMRQQAWRESLTAAGLETPDELVVTETYGVDAGARAMARLLALPEPPTAVFAYSDELAFAAIAYARAHGVDVPGDLSVIGTDGHPLGELLDLTTIDQDVAGQGRLAAELAVRLLRGVDEVANVRVEAQLVDRGSTASLA
ncbi:MAG TPA: LacI family DNA-binding transcriptional regulator [Nocardioides sp.]|uniref:LacI family DNA-binding transcriptional regulator n=1 Tax=uncultured Nocardioides sp. TaxID=198441 RepID=UPI002624BE88|nr:LacI family DNA-binding transcriptional regulator [uncultured Nocardioides sp.]HRD62717.1 LacI family DNA-binding transcriptional regulator [Nocardioides sp.]HRI95691.1 LacI family DNA-binding transcriptional regulator [Nocardioides sp.]HRK45681.1 LacI family DNA-binding transcriptional regulator [Nocardioides sp.]